MSDPVVMHHPHCPLWRDADPGRIAERWAPEDRNSCQCDALWTWECGVANAIAATADADGEIPESWSSDPGVIAAEHDRPWTKR